MTEFGLMWHPQFADHVMHEGRCIVWTSATNHSGYGLVTSEPGKSQERLAHRLAYRIAFGPIPEGLVIRHTCDVPSCVNPEHLTTGTRADNSRDMVERGRSRRGRRNHNSKLNDGTVKVARILYRYGLVSQTWLANRLGVSRGTMSEAISGKLWGHV